MISKFGALVASAAVLTIGVLPVEAQAKTPSTPPSATGQSLGASSPSHPRTVFSDDFSSGFNSSPTGKWQLYPGLDDGIISTSAHGLKVVPRGKNPLTGLPAFTVTTAQDSGLPGHVDHGKFAAFPSHLASSGANGFDTPANGAMTCTTKMSATTFGTEQHPFGNYVTDPRSDLRLAAGATMASDLASGMSFDFWITNSKIYAFYERLRQPGTSYAAFSYAVPVATRTPGKQNTYEFQLDKNRTRATWKVDGRKVLSVDRIGTRALDSRYLLIDHGGNEETVAPQQLACGVASFTLLDGAGANGKGLVRLDASPRHYFAPRGAAGVNQQFFDTQSLPKNRLWGQGANLDVASVKVTTH
jgi:hypothetical protein